MATYLKPLIHTIKTGDKDNVKQAQKNIESFYHNYYRDNRQARNAEFRHFLEELPYFDNIGDENHQAYFLSSLKWAFWAIGEEHFENWVAFMLKVLQHDSGKIRYAAFHIADILMISLRDLDDLKPKDNVKLRMALVNILRQGLWTYTVEKLIQQHKQPIHNRYKYIDSLPPSVYKTLNQLLAQRLLCSNYWTKLYQWVLFHFEPRIQRLYSGDFSSDLKLLVLTIDTQDLDAVAQLSRKDLL